GGKRLAVGLEKGPPAEEVHQTAEKDNADDEGRGERGDEHGTRSDIQAGANTWFGGLLETMQERLDGAVKELGRQHHSHACEEETPFQGPTPQHGSSRDDECGEEEENEKTGMAANSQFEPAQGVANLL